MVERMARKMTTLTTHCLRGVWTWGKNSKRHQKLTRETWETVKCTKMFMDFAKYVVTGKLHGAHKLI